MQPLGILGWVLGDSRVCLRLPGRRSAGALARDSSQVDILRHNLGSIFHTIKYDRIEAHTVKITRDAELSLDDDVSKSFMEQVQKGLMNRREGDPVRVVYDQQISGQTLGELIKGLGITEFDTLIPGGRYHNKKDLVKFPQVGRKELEHPKLPQIAHPDLDVDRSIIQVLQKKDVLLFTWYFVHSLESSESYRRF